MSYKMQETRIKNFSVCLSVLFLASCFLPLASSWAQTITLSADACANATAHTPAPDVAYTPGIDAMGNAVVPADIPAATGTPQPPQTITIPLQLDLKNALRLPSTSKYTSSDTNLGIIEYKDGKTTFNGQPIDAAAEVQIQAACAQIQGASGKKQDILQGRHDLLKSD